jgi:hypothetical protein
MREKHGLAALALGTLLCFILPAPTYAQDKLERYVASQPGVEVQLLSLLPPSGGTGSGPADLVEQSNRTEVVVTLMGAPPDLVSPGLIAEIHEGTCTTLKSAPVLTADETSGGYPLTPSVFSLQSFGAILPVSLVALRSSAHTITVRFGRETGNAAFACFEIA